MPAPVPSTDPPGLDLLRLRAYLDQAAPGLVEGELSARIITGGKSNLTYVLADHAGRTVLRRPPLGHVLATAHDMGREYRVLTALAATAVPVPAPLLNCEDAGVLGAPFYVMDYVEGTVFRSPSTTADLGPVRATTIAHALIDALAQVHAVDPEAVGLSGFGRPHGFLDRQVHRWKRQLDASRSRPLPGADELHSQLASSIPAGSRTCLLHGDFRLDNVVVGQDDRIAAVLDWEMSTLGDPLCDLALFLVYYAGIPAMSSAVITSPEAGFPEAAHLVARYARQRPLDLTRLDWYLALAYYNLAAISEGIHLRHTTGRTVGPGFEAVGDSVLPLFDAARAAIARDAARVSGPTAVPTL